MPPTSKFESRSFLGLSIYYREFLKNYASVAIPLVEIMKKIKKYTLICVNKKCTLICVNKKNDFYNII